MKVLNKDKFVADVVARATESGYTEGQIYTVRKIAENTREVRLKDDKALALLGMNVYTVTYDAYMEAVKDGFYDIEENEYKEASMIKELDIDDKRIDKK